MKINIIPCIIAVAASALIAYGMYTWCHMNEMRLIVGLFCGISMFLTMGATFGLNMPKSRTSVNFKITSGVFAGIILLTNTIFCCVSRFSFPLYIIINGLLLLTWLLVVYGIARANKEV